MPNLTVRYLLNLLTFVDFFSFIRLTPDVKLFSLLLSYNLNPHLLLGLKLSLLPDFELTLQCSNARGNGNGRSIELLNG